MDVFSWDIFIVGLEKIFVQTDMEWLNEGDNYEMIIEICDNFNLVDYLVGRDVIELVLAVLSEIQFGNFSLEIGG